MTIFIYDGLQAGIQHTQSVLIPTSIYEIVHNYVRELFQRIFHFTKFTVDTAQNKTKHVLKLIRLHYTLYIS